MKTYLSIIFICLVQFGNAQDGKLLFNKMPNYTLSKTYKVDFQGDKFWINDKETIYKEGSYVHLTYNLSNSKMASTQEIQENHINAAKAMGGELLYRYDGGRYRMATMKVPKDGKDIYVEIATQSDQLGKKYFLKILQEEEMEQVITPNRDYDHRAFMKEETVEVVDRNNTRDYPLFSNRMPGFMIWESPVAEFDSHTFYDSANNQYLKEGKKFAVHYRLVSGATYPGVLGILRNYQNAIEQLSGTTLRLQTVGNQAYATFKVDQGTKEIWLDVHVDNVNKRYNLQVIETQAMTQVLDANPDYLAENIKNTGKVAIYDILFDTNKSTIKPESTQAIAHIAQLLQNYPDMKVYIVGHTDMVGDEQDNITLSRNRADAVVAVLVDKHKINSSRLTARGAGPLNPVATNNTEAGRKMNRRVVLVKQLP